MLTAAVILLVILLLLYWKLATVKKLREPPRLSGELPLIGHAHLFIGDTKHFWKVLKYVSNKCSTGQQACTILIGLRKYYVITDPEDCLKVANLCLGKDVVYEFAKPFFGEGLVTASVPIWKEHRKILNPAFNQKFMLGFLDIFNDQARQLVEDLKVEVGRAPFDHDPYIRRTAMEAICLTAFGVNFSKNNDLNDRYRHASESLLKILCERFQKVWLHNEFIWNLTSTKKKHDELVKELRSISNMVVQNRKKNFHSKESNDLDLKGEKFKPFLDLLFELNDSNGKEAFSEQEIREHVDTFIVAGHDTVAGTLVFTLLLIGSYPEVQEKICEELQEVFGESDRNVTKEDLARLVYLEAVLKETMRVYPVVPVVARKVDTDVQLKNYTLSSGNTCVLLYVGVHRHPIWGENPEQFKPERWLQQSTLPENTNAFVAFGLGRRVCIARPYAMFIMKTIISHVLRHYRVSGDHLKMVNTFDCLLKTATGHYISLERRTP